MLYRHSTYPFLGKLYDDSIPKIMKAKSARDMTEMVKHLPSKYKAMSSNHYTKKKKKKKNA
jgi:hypothetical protein